MKSVMAARVSIGYSRGKSEIRNPKSETNSKHKTPNEEQAKSG
jgi:hypothetical protein